MEKLPPGAGKSSFDLLDRATFFAELHFKEGIVFADLGCGVGNYTVAVARVIGPSGLAYGIDLWEEGLFELRDRASKEGLQNIKTIAADIAERIPLDDRSTDVCLMATVLHDLVSINGESGALKEARRLLKQDGTLAIVEYKKFEGKPGPPMNVKLSPEQTQQIVTPHGFTKKLFADLGEYHYLIAFSAAG